MVLGWLLYAIIVAWQNSLTSKRRTGHAKAAYSAPRRFGLGTLFLITLAFALLVTGMRLLGVHGAVTLAAIGFLALVGGMQMALDRAPRQASMIAGALVVPATVLVLWVAGERVLLAGPGFLPLLELVFALACWSVAGGALGYLAGIMVGSAFMMADWFRFATQWRSK
jgi:hypothetical protein